VGGVVLSVQEVPIRGRGGELHDRSVIVRMLQEDVKGALSFLI
jgi:hypothetical protein